MKLQRLLLLAAIFILCATEFLHSGMVTFAAGPIMGEIGAGPEEFSIVAALYACVAVISIAKQHWLMERVGMRRYLAGSCIVFITGALLCANGDRLLPFAVGRVIMAFGGGALMATARILVNLLPPGPSRFTGIKVFASGLGGGMALAPFIASWSITVSDRALLFYSLSAIMFIGTVLAVVAVPRHIKPETYSSQSGIRRLLLLSVSSFSLLYLLQLTYYDFYSNSTILACLLALAAFALYSYFHLEHAHPAPLLKVREVISRRYVIGMCIFAVGYLLLGANNYVIPIFLQRGLGYSWETTGTLQAFGLFSSVISWLVMSWFVPRYPGLRKYLTVGLGFLVIFAWEMALLSPDADPYLSVLPALACYGSFIILTLATAAMQTFRELLTSDRLFVHGFQLKAMMAQIAIAAGTALATIFMQWRSTVQYERLTVRIYNSSPIFDSSMANLASFFRQHGSGNISGRQALASIAQELSRQATLNAGLEFFHVIAGCGILSLGLLAVYYVRSRLSAVR